MSRLLLVLAAFGGCYRDAAPAPPPAREEPIAQASPVVTHAPAKPVPPSQPDAIATPTMCDEVPCDHPNACCDDTRRWRKPARPAQPSTTLDRPMIVAGIAAVKPTVAACGANAPAKGIVKVHVIVAPNGKPTNVVIAQGIDPAIDRCVATAMQRASFDATDSGGAFSYPFAF